MKQKPRIFVTNGSYPNGLAAVRALSRGGFRVTVGERVGVAAMSTVSFWSRYCAETFRYPDPIYGPAATAAALAEHFRCHRYEAAIPVGLDLVEVFAKYGESFTTPVMLPPYDSFRIAADKRLTFEHAATVGIPVPRTIPAEQWREMELPLVFKNPRTGATIAHTPEEAAAQAELLGSQIKSYIAQEYIPGKNGFGYFGFFQNGRETAYFMHERLMQFPKEGGPSVVARAIRDSRLRELGRTLLASLCWHGAAMVEFKRSDRNGEFYLMEINPKLWGSLDLAIQSGCNFPLWIAKALTDGSGPDRNCYQEGLIYQWIVPNGLKCFLKYPEFRIPFLKNLVASGVRTEVWWQDPLPTVAGLLAMASHLVKR